TFLVVSLSTFFVLSLSTRFSSGCTFFEGASSISGVSVCSTTLAFSDFFVAVVLLVVLDLPFASLADKSNSDGGLLKPSIKDPLGNAIASLFLLAALSCANSS